MNSESHPTRVYKIVIAILSVMVVALAYLYLTQRNQTQVRVVEVTKALNEKDSIRNELQLLYSQYDTLKLSNETMREEFEVEQVKIKQLMEDLKTSKSVVKNYQKELNTLRDVMKSYIIQIDSLNTRNQILVRENREVSSLLETERQAKQVLETEKQNLAGKVEMASVLRADNLAVNPMKSRNRSTTKASKVEKIEVCFSLMENPIIPAGVKEIFLRVARPDELILANSANDLFDYQGKSIVFSAKREVDYLGRKLNSCIYYENRQSLGPGVYNADLFSGGQLIGSTTFTLE